MTDKDAFSDAEWTLLQITPATVAVAVAKAADSGVWGGLQEMRAIAASADLGPKRYPRNELIAAISDRPANLADGLDDKTLTPEAIGDLAVTRCTAVNGALARVPPDEASDVRLWLLDIAQHVAEAAKEGDILVSESEARLIDRLGAALS